MKVNIEMEMVEEEEGEGEERVMSSFFEGKFISSLDLLMKIKIKNFRGG